MESSIFALLQGNLEDYREQITQYLSSGYAKNMEDYARMVGKIEAINVFLEDIKALEKRYIEI